MNRQLHFDNYISNGWICFPCIARSKAPMVKEWQKRRETYIEEFLNLEKARKDYNIGVLAGSASGIVMIDVDGELGKLKLSEISKGDMPRTATFKTPGGGVRYIYKIPEGYNLKTHKISLEGEHQEICLMSDGKYSIVPPSTHPNGGRYEWLQGLSPEEVIIPDAPKWILNLMNTKKKVNQLSKSTILEVQHGNKKLNIQSNSDFLILKLAELCPCFKELLKQQREFGVDEETWFSIINLFSCAGCYGSAFRFSKLSVKHNTRSEERLEALKEKVYTPKKCIDFGCNYSKIFNCMGFVNENKDGVFNSPLYFIERFKPFNMPEQQVYKPVINMLMKSKDYALDENGHVYKLGKHPYKISNFIAYSMEELITNDNNDESNKVKVIGILEGGKKLREVIINSDQFIELNWIPKLWGLKPFITTGKTNKSDMRELIQLLSQESEQTHISTNTGWVESEDGKWTYIHAGGCIGENNIEVKIDSQLNMYNIAHHDEKEIHDCVLTTMKILELANENIIVPLLGVVFLTPLTSIIDENNTPKFVTWIYGLTGSRKTSLAMCALNFFGSFGNNPIMSFRDTANSIEMKTHILKDNLVLVDDYAPTLSSYEASKISSIAERLLRIYGDRIGRGRLSSSIDMKKSYFPRGMCMVTGEDIPKGTSSIARYIGIEVKRNDIDLEILSLIQDNFKDLSVTMNSYIEYLANNIDYVKLFVETEFKNCRLKYSSKTDHGRISDAISWLEVGFKIFLKYIYEYMNIYLYKQETLENQCYSALNYVLEQQNEQYKKSNVDEVFLEALVEGLNAGKVHVLDLKDEDQSNELKASNPKGTFIGYEDSEFLYLIPGIAYSEVNRLLSDKGMKVSISIETLWKTMRDKSLIKTEKDQLKPKKMVPSVNGGKIRTRLIHLYKSKLK